MIFAFGFLLAAAVLWDAWLEERTDTADKAEKWLKERRKVK